jgi:hypothetical protein
MQVDRLQQPSTIQNQPHLARLTSPSWLICCTMLTCTQQDTHAHARRPEAAVRWGVIHSTRLDRYKASPVACHLHASRVARRPAGAGRVAAP